MTAAIAALPRRERAMVVDAVEDASVSAFHLGIGLAAALVGAGGLISAAGIRNPRRVVSAADCPGGAFCGASRQAA
jgi:hypothetical protein